MEEAERRIQEWWSASDMDATLDLHGLGLVTLPVLPLPLRHLNVSYNKIEALPKLGKYLLTLGCTGNCLVELPNLPPNLRVLACSDNRIRQLPALPRSLVHLTCAYNCLKELPISLEACLNLKHLDCESNAIKRLPGLSDTVETLCIGNNGMLALQSHRPKSLSYLSSSRNVFKPFVRYEVSIQNYWDSVVQVKNTIKYPYTMRGLILHYCYITF
jgi:Leucine-rich repeat (LRR) protein